MLDTFNYEKRTSYPHMSVKDTEIWNRFIAKFPTEFLTCQYDFHIGEPPPFNTLMDDDTDLNQDKLYRLRIDVVAVSKDRIYVIEIKPNAGPSAIGQLQSYASLYERDENPKMPVEMILITDREVPNMDFLCKDAKIKLVVV